MLRSRACRCRGETMYFVVFYSNGPSWNNDAPLFEQSRTALRALAAHRDYLRGLLDAGTLVLAGPFSDGTGGIALVDVETESDAEAVVADDPGITSGVFLGQLRAW